MIVAAWSGLKDRHCMIGTAWCIIVALLFCCRCNLKMELLPSFLKVWDSLPSSAFTLTLAAGATMSWLHGGVAVHLLGNKLYMSVPCWSACKVENQSDRKISSACILCLYCKLRIFDEFVLRFAWNLGSSAPEYATGSSDFGTSSSSTLVTWVLLEQHHRMMEPKFSSLLHETASSQKQRRIEFLMIVKGLCTIGTLAHCCMTLHRLHRTLVGLQRGRWGAIIGIEVFCIIVTRIWTIGLWSILFGLWLVGLTSIISITLYVGMELACIIGPAVTLDWSKAIVIVASSDFASTVVQAPSASLLESHLCDRTLHHHRQRPTLIHMRVTLHHRLTLLCLYQDKSIVIDALVLRGALFFGSPESSVSDFISSLLG